MATKRFTVSDLVNPVSERVGAADLPVFSVSESKGVVLQEALFNKRIATDDTSSYLRVHKGDLVYNPYLLWNGAVGACLDFDEGCTSPAYKILRPKHDGVERFLHYLFRSDSFKSRVDAIAQGSVTRRRVAPLQAVLGLEFELPAVHEQLEIARALDALDGLIATNQLLASQAGEAWRAIVDQSIVRSMDLRPLSELAEFVNGRNFTKDASGEGRPVIRTPEVRTGPSRSTVRSEADAPEQHLARVGDILFVWSGSLMVNRWSSEEGLVNQHVFKVIPRNVNPDWLVMYAIETQMQWFLGLAADKATTMGHIKRSHLDEAVALPSLEECAHLEQAVGPLWDAELELQVEAKHVERTRDELLPALISGRVSLGEVD